MGKLVNQRELADILGVDPNTIRNWRGMGMPAVSLAGKKGESSQYDTEACILWIRNRELGDGDGEVIDRKVEEARLAKFKAAREELELQEKQGTLLSAAEVEETWTRILANFRAKLLALPSRLAPELADLTDPKEVQGFLKRAINETLEELSNTDVEEVCGNAAQDDPFSD